MTVGVTTTTFHEGDTIISCDCWGKVPKGAMFIISSGITPGAIVRVANHCVGAADWAGYQWATAQWIQDNTVVSAFSGTASHNKAEGVCILQIVNATVVSQASLVAFRANGCELAWAINSGTSQEVHAVFFWGDNWECQAGTTFAKGVGPTLPNYIFNETSNEDGVWSPDAVFLAGVPRCNPGSEPTTLDDFTGPPVNAGIFSMGWSFGWAAFDPRYKAFDALGTYGGVGYLSSNRNSMYARPIQSEPFQAQGFFPSAYYTSWSLAACGYDVIQYSDGFGVTHGLGGTYVDEKVGYFALRWIAGQIHGGAFTIQQGFPSQAFSGWGGAPSFVLLQVNCSQGDSLDNGELRSNANYGVALIDFDLSLRGWTESGKNINSDMTVAGPSAYYHQTIDSATGIVMTTNTGAIHMAPFPISLDADGMTLAFDGPPPFLPLADNNTWAWLAFLNDTAEQPINIGIGGGGILFGGGPEFHEPMDAFGGGMNLNVIDIIHVTLDMNEWPDNVDDMRFILLLEDDLLMEAVERPDVLTFKIETGDLDDGEIIYVPWEKLRFSVPPPADDTQLTINVPFANQVISVPAEAVIIVKPDDDIFSVPNPEGQMRAQARLRRVPRYATGQNAPDVRRSS